MDITDEEKWNFLDGSTDAALNKKIQETINSNPTFKLEMEEMRLLWNDLNSIQEHKELKKSFNQYHDEHFPITSKPVKKKSKKIWLYTLSSAAGIALMFTISQLFWQNEMATSADNASYQEMKKESHAVEENDTYTDDNTQAIAQATAFSINDSLLFTSFHSIKNTKKIRVKQTGSNNWIDAKLVTAHKNYDIAIIQIIPDSLKVKPHKLYIERTKLKLGQELFGLGYPKNDLVYGKGEISSLSGYQSDTNMIQVSVPTNPGNSGTPLFNKKGALVSLIVGKNIQEEGSAYGVSNYQILDFLKEVGIRPSSRNRLKSTKHLDQIQQLKTSIFLLESE
jgi:S1-C subfamily serine protease